ncbi:MAG: septal ring lytic transglycosylase RlpA family protein [Thiohalorhabdaceae bacterium]
MLLPLHRWLKVAGFSALPLLLAACATSLPGGQDRTPPKARKGEAYQVGGEWYHPLATARGYREVGKASWYGRKFHGRKTASGETYNMHLPTAAHRTLPLPTIARVTNLDNGRSTEVRVNDRGPFVDTRERIIDLSYGAAKRLGIDETGVAQVRVVALKGPGKVDGTTGSGTSRNPDPKAESGSEPTLYLQVGAFREEGNAAQLKQRLRGMDMKRVVVTTGDLGGDTVYRVRIGPLANVARADHLAERLHRAGLPSGQLVRD